MARRKEGMSGGEERNLSKVTNLRNADSRGGGTERNMGKLREGKRGSGVNLDHGMTVMTFWQEWKH